MKLAKRLAVGAIAAAVAGLWSGAGAARDGQHDFDFDVGVWHTHIKRIKDPLEGGTHVIELEGTVSVHRVWGGKAQLEEIETDGPEGHWEGMTLFLYNPKAQQWSMNFINSQVGELSSPIIGEFKDGRAELFSQDTLGGRAILVRGVWSDITADSHTYAESYSPDGGKSWAPYFVAHLTRETQTPKAAPGFPAAAPGSHDPQHDFDFDLGSWKTHSSRLMHPLSGAKDWKDMDGGTVVTPIWGGRANLAEYKAEGPAGSVELLALRWYNPTSHQWNLDFATPGAGTLGTPGVGEFRNGRGDFYDTESIKGRYVLVRFSIWGISADTAQSEQAFSTDGGQTWEVNWVNKYTRR
jgi:hypothetical protein